MKHLSSVLLVARLKQLVAQERAITVQQIEHLGEIDRRKCYFDYNCSSLWDFMIQELGLSSGSAQRRKDAMQLVRDEPSIKVNLLDGSLTLTNAAQVQSFRRRTGKKHDPRVVVDQIANLTQDDCTRKLYEMAPEALPQERLRIGAPEARELRVVISEELHQKLELIKGRLVHAKPHLTYAELLTHLADMEIARLEKLRGLKTVILNPTRKPKQTPDWESKSESRRDGKSEGKREDRDGDGAEDRGEDQSEMSTPFDAEADSTATVAPLRIDSSPALPIGIRVPLPAALRREVWRDAGGRCELCTSTYQLEIDHITPLSHGGSNDRENLRLLCRNHNQRPRLAPDPWETFPEFAEVV